MLPQKSYQALGFFVVSALLMEQYENSKACYCVRGDLQEVQEGSFETYAPVAMFSSVRHFLILTLISTHLQWFTCSIDFSSAFTQAHLKKPIWVHKPRGFRSLRPGKTCLRLKGSYYGIAEAPRLWFLHLSEAFESLGFARNPIDPCLLMREDCFIIIYVDDCVIAVKRKSIATKLVNDLKSKGFDLTLDASFSDF